MVDIMSNNRKKRVNRKRGRKTSFWLFIISIIIVGGGYSIFSLAQNSVNSKVYMEAGQGSINLKDFDKSEKASFASDVKDISTTIPGEYEVKLKKWIFTLTSTLIIQDTVAPTGEALDMTIWKGDKIEAANLDQNIHEATETTVLFKEAPDFTTPGVQNVAIEIKDAGNNVLELQSKVTIKEDKEAPVITGVKDITAYVGDTISYRKDVTVTDNRNQEIELKIDSSQVNTKAVGNYSVTYQAVDSSGNETTKKATVKIIQKSVSEEQVFAQADVVLNKIIKNDMSKKEKAEEIYKWIRANIAYKSQPSSGNWLKSANQGFTKKSGDCYVYYSLAKALLTRAGIDNMEIVKGDGGHYWNLVNYGSGWYHFDTTPRVGGGDNFCLITDAAIKDYSKKHKNSHFWNESLYPATPVK